MFILITFNLLKGVTTIKCPRVVLICKNIEKWHTFCVAVTKYALSAFSFQANICTQEEKSPRDALLFMEITHLTVATSVNCTMHINPCAAHNLLKFIM